MLRFKYMYFVQLALLFFAYIYCIIIFRQIFKNRRRLIGGAFDPQDLLDGLKKKYGKNSKCKSTNVEVEIKIKCNTQEQTNKILNWVMRQKYTKSKTINKIWNDPKAIETVNEDSGKSTWHKKDRLSYFNIGLPECNGKITVAVEQDLQSPPSIFREPNLFRKKNRISATLNKNWRIDYTLIDDNEIPEIEAEYTGTDFWNSLKKRKEVDAFLMDVFRAEI